VFPATSVAFERTPYQNKAQYFFLINLAAQRNFNRISSTEIYSNICLFQ